MEINKDLLLLERITKVNSNNKLDRGTIHLILGMLTDIIEKENISIRYTDDDHDAIARLFEVLYTTPKHRDILDTILSICENKKSDDVLLFRVLEAIKKPIKESLLSHIIGMTHHMSEICVGRFFLLYRSKREKVGFIIGFLYKNQTKVNLFILEDILYVIESSPDKFHSSDYDDIPELIRDVD